MDNNWPFRKPMDPMPPIKKYVILEGIEEGNRFYSMSRQDDTMDSLTRLGDGTVAYRVLGFADTIKEVEMFLFGRIYTDSKD